MLSPGRITVIFTMALLAACGGQTERDYAGSDATEPTDSGGASGDSVGSLVDGQSGAAPIGGGGVHPGTGGESGAAPIGSGGVHPGTGGESGVAPIGSGGAQAGTGGESGAAPTGSGGVQPGTGGEGGVGQPIQPLPPPRTVECFSAPFFDESHESLSANGRWFTFSDHLGGGKLLDRETGNVQQFLASDPPALSADGGWLLYKTGSGNPSRAVIWSRETETEVASYGAGDSVRGALSRDGRFAVFSSRDQSITDPPPNVYGGVVVVDLATGETWQASVSSSGVAGTDHSGYSVDISDDGQRVVFASLAMNIVPGKPSRRYDVYLHDTAQATTVLAAPTPDGGYGDNYSSAIRISGDGQTIVFESLASDLVQGDTEDSSDLFFFDPATGNVSSFTVGHSIDTTGTSYTRLGNISSDGRFVLFGSDREGVVEEDMNGVGDVFVYDRATGQFDLVSRELDGSPMSEPSQPVSISGDGRVMAFVANAETLSATNGDEVVCFAERE